mgnify:FL=1
MSMMKATRGAISTCFLAAAMTIGFASYKAAISCSYRTAMGSVTETCGYVSDVGFMIVVNASSFVTALIVYLLYRKGVVAEGGIVQSPAIIALSTGMLVSREEAASALPAEILVVILGAVCGFSIVLLCVVWIDTLVRLRTMKLALLVLVLGLTLKEVVYAWACGLSGIAFQLFTVGLLLLSAILLFFSNRNRRPVELSQTLEEDKYSFVKSFIALFILVGIVGIIHTTVIGSSAEGVVGQVDMDLAGELSSIAALVITVAMGWNVSTLKVGKVAFPCVLVALSLLPLLGESNGALVGFISIFCYEVYSKVFLAYILCECYRTKCSSLTLSCFFTGGTGGSLAIGLSIGLLLSSFSAGHEVSILALLTVAAIYPIALGTMVLYRRGDGFRFIHKSDGKSEPGRAIRVDESYELETACRSIADESGLTPRELDVLVVLAKGRSAKHIADELCIAENTAWVHIKSIYAKTGAHGKQGLIDLVEEARASTVR